MSRIRKTNPVKRFFGVYFMGAMIFIMVLVYFRGYQVLLEPRQLLVPMIGYTFGYLAIKIGLYLFRRHLLAGASMKKIDKMDGVEFEEYLAILYKIRGYKVQLTPGTCDYGADLILEKKGEVTVVQAKRYRYNVPESAVQQVISAREYYGATNAKVVTNSIFTQAAMKLADKCDVELIDRLRLKSGRI